MNEATKRKTKRMLNDDNTSFNDFSDFLRTNDLGNWDNVNDEDIIKQYLNEKMKEGIHISHIIEALETNPSSQELYCIWLGNSMETPTPINNKKDLLEALEVDLK